MDTEGGSAWVSFVQWVFTNPEKTALFLVFVAGVWSYIRELLKSRKGEEIASDFTQMLIKENRDLRAELRDYRRKSKLRAEDDHDSSGGPTA